LACLSVSFVKEELRAPYMDIVTAYTKFSMLTTYPSQVRPPRFVSARLQLLRHRLTIFPAIPMLLLAQFVLYTILPNFPKLHQVRNKSQMVNSFVLDHVKAQVRLSVQFPLRPAR
jgi:hypothetical protein